MRGIYKTHGYWQTQEARRDWAFLMRWAEDNGHRDVAESVAPKNGAGWRTIDKCIDKLRLALSDIGVDLPPCPSNTAKFSRWVERTGYAT